MKNIQVPKTNVGSIKNTKRINRNQSNIRSNSFDQILNKVNQNNRIKFSKHAKLRLQNRNINLNEKQLSKIERAVQKADNKGIKEALILMDKTAFVTSVRNKTIITTANTEQLGEKVFTNIDGAVII